MPHELLVDQLALGTRMRNCRWNVTGPQSLHRLFASHQKVLDEILDDMAERSGATGDGKTAAVAYFLKSARTKAHLGVHPLGIEITAELLAGHEAVLHRLREILESCAGKHRDACLRDFFSDMMQKHRNMAQDIRAVLAEPILSRTNLHAKKSGDEQVLCDSI